MFQGPFKVIRKRYDKLLDYDNASTRLKGVNDAEVAKAVSEFYIHSYFLYIYTSCFRAVVAPRHAHLAKLTEYPTCLKHDSQYYYTVLFVIIRNRIWYAAWPHPWMQLKCLFNTTVPANTLQICNCLFDSHPVAVLMSDPMYYPEGMKARCSWSRPLEYWHPLKTWTRDLQVHSTD